MTIACLSCENLKLSQYLEEQNKSEVLLLSSFVIPVPCNCQNYCSSFVPQPQCSSWVSLDCQLHLHLEMKNNLQGQLRILSSHLKNHISWKVFPLVLMFGWSLMLLIYFFCNWFNFSNCSQWEHCMLSLSHVQLFMTLMDCSPPGFSVHGIFQARIHEWVAISFSRGSSQPPLSYHTISQKCFAKEQRKEMRFHI